MVAGALGGRPGPGLSRASHGGPALPEDVVRNDETRLEEEHICLDLQMPDIGGAEVLRLLREDPDTRDIPVVVVTGAPLDDAGRRRLSELSAHVLTKDAVSRERLLAAVDAAMRTPAGAA